MTYDALAGSVRLLDGAPPADTARLSRRVRHLPLAVDRDGDVAVTLWLRRGVSGAAQLDVHVLERTSGGWRVLGGGGGAGDDVLRARPSLAELGAAAVSSDGGGVRRSDRGLLPSRSGSWISYAGVRAAQEVAALRVGTRLLPVAGHGCAVVVWTRRPPRVTALDAAGAPVGAVPVGSRVRW
ncbi:hypothetical protein DQ239_14840 [Blastococcus sp. TF02-09]|uniref:hypothetical protein n=1 Tax=Blastococcus sp. TF02-09 TaxID=2250576 RepID=UPI000DEAA9AE|nr:hypothetical protein [Blastococcus sp. TF02-9]RBY76255.1 hypothetical protein DQ239_14840 [Blastococcus sp. TF02-9]